MSTVGLLTGLQTARDNWRDLAHTHILIVCKDCFFLMDHSEDKWMEEPFSHNQRDFHGLGFHDSSVGKEPTCNAEDPRPQLNSWVGKICWRRDRLPTPVFLGFSCGSTGKQSAWNADGLIPGSGRSPRERIGYSLQYSFASLVAQLVKNLPAKRETWNQSLSWEDPLEEGLATYSSILAWRIPVDRGAWPATVHRVTKNRMWLSD